ncbi:pre-peptidase C-terminal domain-containing protein [Rhodanobacter sp. AS-Z3]|uniref:pre-peptidase C-terminal domain-containing protein n=1 Tax=Rhodanobacter sp. AS-Z3 TaxID=3031330 RepID=UPI00247A0694|nr:pre-peptidase C-terminal domain-containing protein [Rhodanobacter sp. AS-Z3]WEN15292.1 pre-peptidase C-terminal domain-containing protein [Rhodanobacter sp. AS-Z3]
MPNHFRLTLLTAAISMAAITSANATLASSNAFVALSQHATQLRRGDVISGPLATSQPIHIEVALKLRNPSQLQSFIATARTSTLSMARHSMPAPEFVSSYAPTATQANKVAAWLRSVGFTNVQIAPNRMLVSADGRADTAQAAFKTTFAQVRTREGRMAFMHNGDVQIPAALQDSVLSVIGLQSVHQAHTFAVPMQASYTTQAVTGHNPTEFASIYGGSGVATAAGVPVGIVTQGKITQTITDLNTFTDNAGLARVTTQTINTNGTSTDTSGLGEWSLDSQDVVGMAGGQVGSLIFYNIPTLSNANLTADFNTIVSANATKIINVSLGECETSAQSDGSAAAQDQIFQQAVAQGQTFSISTGDSGADECSDGGVTPSWPSASQYVVAVGGTTLNASTTTWNSATVWASGGGSSSTFEAQPSWQNGVAPGNKRGLPDIAYDADPNSGSKIIVSGATQQYGGTSLAAPLFAGAWARMIAIKGSSIGFAAPLLYQLPASAFHDITSGNNGGETASAGYDLATGRGELIISAAANGLGGGSSNVPPVANFGDVVNGLAVSFTDSSTDSDGNIASRSWNFGDGSTSTATNPSHTYAAAGTYTVSLQVTDNAGASNTKTASVTVASAGGGGGNVLQNGVALTGQAAGTGAQLAYTVVIPAGASNLVISESGGTGDADLYTKFGSAPTLSSYDCRPYITGNNESCSVAAPQAGTYYVMLNGYAAFSGVSVKATWTTGSGGGTGGTVLQNGVPVTGLHATKNNAVNYTMVVPAGATNVHFALSGGTGDADMYVKLGSAPTTSSYDCRPYVAGNSETCNFSSSTGGTYYIMVRAYSSYTGVTLSGSYTP